MVSNLCVLQTRSLSLFRIGLSVLILCDLALRVSAYNEHYSSEGIAPISLLGEPTNLNSVGWSLCFLSFSDVWTKIVFCLAALCGLSLLVGFRSRFACIASWVLIVSIQARNPMISFGVDSLAAVLFFWAMWLPLDHHWSLDSRAKNSASISIQSAGCFALTVQVALVYLINALAKGGAEWRVDHTALQLVLQTDSFSTQFGHYLTRFPELLKVGTSTTLYLEEIAPVLLFIPLFKGHLKTIAVFSMVSFHIGIGLTMHLGVFPLAGVVAWLPFFPGSFWELFFGYKSNICQSNQLSSGRLASCFCYFLIVYVLLWNLRYVTFADNPWFLPRSTNWIGKITRLQQKWTLFAPKPNTFDGWFVAVAHLKDGSEIDLLNNGSILDYKRPDDLSSRFDSCRERTYLFHLFSDPNFLRTECFVNSLKFRWASRRTVEIESIHVFLMSEDNRLPERGIVRYQLWPYETENEAGKLKFKELPIIP